MFYWMLQRWLFYLSPCFEALFTSTLPGDTSAICCSIWKSITEKTNDYSVVKFPPPPPLCAPLWKVANSACKLLNCACADYCVPNIIICFGIDLNQHHEMLALNSINFLWSLHSTLMHIIEGSWHWNWGQ